jgi:hypothetical protein
MTLPPLYRVPAAGWVIVGDGAWFVDTVSTASVLVTMPKSLVTTAQNRAPLSDWTTEAIV